MANDIPASLVGVDSANLLAGSSLRSSAIAQLGQASNSVVARIGSGTPRISQVWPRIGSSDPPTQHLDFRSAADDVAQWRIPDTRGATSVDCYIYGESATGAGAKYRFRSSEAGVNTGWQNFTVGASLHGPHSLTIDASGGHETIHLGLDGATSHALVDSVLVIVPEASSIGAGDIAGMTGIDADEMGVDEPLSSDLGRRIIATASAARDVPHVYWSWSGVDGVHGHARSEYMRSAPHTMTALVWPDTDREEWVCTVWVLAEQSATGGYQVRVHASPSWRPAYRRTLTIDIPIGAASWQTGTIRFPMRTRAIGKLGRAVADIGTVTLTIWPVPTAPGAAGRAAGMVGGIHDEMFTTADVYGVSVWGP